MEQEQFLAMLREALIAIREPRFFNTERGYQGELLSEIRARLAGLPIWPGAPIVEQEYQKIAEVHRVTIRPDIIIHHPFERGKFEDRGQGNFVVIELKRCSTRLAAVRDYEKLSSMCTTLNYAAGVFVNIDATNTFLSEYDGAVRDKLYGFAVRLRDGQVQIQEDH